MTVVSDSHYQSTLDTVNVYVVPWSEFPIVPSLPTLATHPPPLCLTPTPVLLYETLLAELQGSGCWLQGTAFRVQREQVAESRFQGAECRVQGSGSMVQGEGVGFQRSAFVKSNIWRQCRGTSPIIKRPPP